MVGLIILKMDERSYSIDFRCHHQFAGYLTPRAVEAAADPARFPEQLAQGLLPWRVAKLYVAERLGDDDSADGRLIVDTSTHDPVAGQSYFQIGMQGRSQQKTQQMGSMEYYGSQYSVLRLVHSGFGDGPDWNDEYGGISRGWVFELGCLKHYMERHLGRERHYGWVNRPTELGPEEAWSRVLGSDGLLAEGSLAGLSAISITFK